MLQEGRAVMGKLLVELQVRKSTADGPGARQFYTELTTPLPGWDGEIRDLVLKKTQASLTMVSGSGPSDNLITFIFLAKKAIRAGAKFDRGFSSYLRTDSCC